MKESLRENIFYLYTFIHKKIQTDENRNHYLQQIQELCWWKML